MGSSRRNLAHLERSYFNLCYNDAGNYDLATGKTEWTEADADLTGEGAGGRGEVTF